MDVITNMKFIAGLITGAAIVWLWTRYQSRQTAGRM